MNDYRGRLLYELLQNAIDRAEKEIWIDFDENEKRLIVANDGEPFSVEPRAGEPRSDFAALCAIDTSNKKMGNSIGNKGVGFKSIWSLCQSVQIRTRLNNDTQWGMRLRRPFKVDHLQKWTNRKVADRIEESIRNAVFEEKHRGTAPSFYFPEFIESPNWAFDKAVTAIELEYLDEDSISALKSLIDEFLEHPLLFASDIRPDVNLRLHVKSTHLENDTVIPLFLEDDKWIRIDIPLHKYQDELMKMASTLGVDLDRLPQLSMAFPLGLQETPDGLVHSYLPTDQKTGKRFHLHGDFYLEESRKSVDFKNTPYNMKLLELACDAMLQAIESNESDLASLPYSLYLLKPEGVFLQILKNELTGNGKRLANLLKQIILKTKDKTEDWYNDLYDIINGYLPSKKYHTWTDHYRLSVQPYLDSIINADLPLIPTEFEITESGDDKIKLVKNAMSWPKLNEENRFKGRVFLRKKQSNLPVVSVPNVVVTDWAPQRHLRIFRDLADEFDLFHDFDVAQVLRAIKDAQQTSSNENERLLSIAATIYSPDQSLSVTNWQFIDTSTAYPSQLLLIPVISGGWIEARKTIIASSHPELKFLCGQTEFDFADESRCEEILGSNWRSILLHWGVWSGIPLLKKKFIPSWTMEFNEDRESFIEDSLIRQSWEIWKQGEKTKQNLNLLFNQLKTIKFVKTISNEKAKPSDVFIREMASVIEGHFTISKQGNCDLYEKLDIKNLEDTTDITKLAKLAQRVLPITMAAVDIKSGVLVLYRSVIKQLNRSLRDELSDSETALIQKLPLPYELKNGRRGIAQSLDDRIWYIPGPLRSSRNRILDESHKVWLATGDVAQLARRIGKIQIFVLKPSPIEAETEFDAKILKDLTVNFLPRFLALVNYSDVVSGEGIEEAVIEKRWSNLEILRTKNATLEEETIDGNGHPVTLETDIEKTGWLWRPYYNDPPKTLRLYILDGVSTQEHQEVLCRWFSEEVFRRRDLVDKFIQILREPNSIQLDESIINDASGVVESWITTETESRVTSFIENHTGLSLGESHWRSEKIYTEGGIDFKELIDAAPEDIKNILSSLNPIERNRLKLKKFLQEHESNIAAIEGGKPNSVDGWLAAFDSAPENMLFHFRAKEWLLARVELSEDEFNALREKIDLALKILQEDESVIKLGESDPAVFESSLFIQKSDDARVPNNPNVVAVKDDIERSQTELENSKAGKNVETQLALLKAREIDRLDINSKERLVDLLIREYKRIGKYSDSEARKLLDLPIDSHTQLSWSRLIHIGARWDGTGYDVLAYDKSRDCLLQIEVKSSRSSEPLIYLSENERTQAVYYLSNEYAESCPENQWRLYFVTQAGHFDVTKSFGGILAKHHQDYVSQQSMVAQGWVIKGFKVVTDHESLTDPQLDDVREEAMGGNS